MPDATYTQTLPDGLSFTLIPVKGDSFKIGSEDGGPFGFEKPPRLIQVEDFYIGKYPVTQALWKAVMGQDNNPSFFTGDRRPVESVSWFDAAVFCNALSLRCQKEPCYFSDAGFKNPYGKTGGGWELPGEGDVFLRPNAAGYRLPTEAEWEYAARGGQASRDYLYAGSDDLKEVGWFAENSHGETKTVGLKRPNELGLFDMSGNVWEWVEDHWHGSYDGMPADGSAWTDREEGSSRVLRGGGWDLNSRLCRVASRINGWPDDRGSHFGFRLVLALQSDGS